MKKTIKIIFIAYLTAASILQSAQVNYCMAVKNATKSEGTDAAIEEAMMKHGFKIEAMDPKEPTTAEKVIALINVITNNINNKQTQPTNQVHKAGNLRGLLRPEHHTAGRNNRRRT